LVFTICTTVFANDQSEASWRQVRRKREHFVREFTKRYGAPPGAALRKLRLEHARAMLNATAIPVEEVALANGFANADTFSRGLSTLLWCEPGSNAAHAVTRHNDLNTRRGRNRRPLNTSES